MSVLDVNQLEVTLPQGGDRPKAVDGVAFQIEKNEILDCFILC